MQHGAASASTSLHVQLPTWSAQAPGRLHPPRELCRRLFPLQLLLPQLRARRLHQRLLIVCRVGRHGHREEALARGVEQRTGVKALADNLLRKAGRRAGGQGLVVRFSFSAAHCLSLPRLQHTCTSLGGGSSFALPPFILVQRLLLKADRRFGQPGRCLRHPAERSFLL